MEHASIAFELLTTDDSVEAEQLAAELERLNIQRQQQTEELMKELRKQAEAQTDKAIILVHGNDWHEGIIGLVAGKLAEETGKPALVLSDDPQTNLSRGSARSHKHFNIIAALQGFETYLERYGGHTQAAGFTIKSALIPQLHTHLLNWQASHQETDLVMIENTPLPDPTGLNIEQENSETNPAHRTQND